MKKNSKLGSGVAQHEGGQRRGTARRTSEEAGGTALAQRRVAGEEDVGTGKGLGSRRRGAGRAPAERGSGAEDRRKR